MITGRKILIIGGTGSLGNSLISRYYGSNNIIIFSRDENKQWALKLKYPNIKYIIGDMRNINSIDKTLRETTPNIIIIAGALKHIDICEYNIGECIDTNITGVRNVIETVNKYPYIETVLLISTDKSCSPINSYGMSKAIGERMIAENSLKNSVTKFLCVRYGNVINSRGSIIPKFKDIGEGNGENFPVTDINMTRFFMTLDQSVKLIETAILHGTTGDTWIPKINSFNIYDIAKVFSEKYNKPISITGIRPGEKIHECLICETELYRTVGKNINNENYYVIYPCYTTKIHNDVKEIYTSEKTSSIDIIKNIIND